MPDTLTIFGVLAIILLCLVSYFPLKTRLEQADVQSLTWGPAVAQLLPLILTAFAILFSCALLIVSTNQGRSK